MMIGIRHRTVSRSKLIGGGYALGARVVAALAGALVFSCADEPTGPPGALTVSVVAPSARPFTVGDTLRLEAEVRDHWGEALTGVSVAWSSSDARIVAVSPEGVATAVGPGTATVTGSVGGVLGAAQLSVADPEAAVLLSLYLSTNGDDWTHNDNWFGSRDLGTWYGVETNSAGRVIGLDLSENNLDGQIPPRLSGLSHLRKLDLSGNELKGAIPGTLGGLAELERLNLSGNRFEGEIPSVLGGLAELERLDLSDNELSGHIPADGNDTGLGRLSNLTWLNLSGNQLDGGIPSELGLLAELETLWLSYNQLEGSLPSELGSLTQLTWLMVGDNPLLKGPLPRSFLGLELEVFGYARTGLCVPNEPDFQTWLNAIWQHMGTGVNCGASQSDRDILEILYNATDGPNWTNDTNWLTDAPLGEWYGVDTDDAGRVTSLVLEIMWDEGAQTWVSPNLSGHIPSELGSLSRLEVLSLKGNNLSGGIPPQLGKLARLRELDLGWNPRLTGSIPPELSQLTMLERLELGDNAGMSGQIPPELGQLASLESLVLHDIRLSGSVPAELGNLARLRVLDLGETGLSGPVPASLGRLQRLEWINIAATDLCFPGTLGFVEWSAQRQVWGPWCNDADFATLRGLYEKAGGNGWANSGGWLADRALARWYGVTADSLGRVLELDLTANGLAGQLTASLGNLTRTTVLRIGANPALSGHLPPSLANVPLRELRYAGTGLCVPRDELFQAWLATVTSHEGTGETCAPLADRDVLEAFYEATGGAGWTNSDNWVTDAPLGEWHGISVDEDGRVTRVDIDDNNLHGFIPPELGSLAKLNVLLLRWNDLAGPIPVQLGELSNLNTLWLNFNSLSGSIPVELGKLANLQSLSLSGNQLTGPIPVELGKLTNLDRAWFYGNRFSGPIPSALGNLARLRVLDLSGNLLSGPIPSALGNLDRLEELTLGSNNLTGSIPAELGNLVNLREMYIWETDLTGSLPPELGNLASLERLVLDENDLTGVLPPELGKLSTLELLALGDNNLTGPVPAEFAGLASLRELHLTRNTRMSGALSDSLTALGRLEALLLEGTGLCAPPEQAFSEWLRRVPKQRVARCVGSGPSKAYLVQAVQSQKFPVPLVADEEALLRVFVTAGRSTEEHLPPVRARFFRDGQQVHMEDISGTTATIPTEVDEANLAASVNAEIPGHVIRPGLEMVIDVDPDGTLDPGLGIAKRIPETGRLAVDVQSMPLFDLTVIPFLWTEEPDSSILDIARAMAADPEGHERLRETRTLLPVGSLKVTAHEPVLTTSNRGFSILSETEALRVLEGADGHYLGMIANGGGPLGVANRGGRSSYAEPRGWIIAHELGHNFNLGHAPCGTIGEPSFPYPDASIGVWGYDFNQSRLVSPVWRDLMSYCSPRWISDYSFANALRYRLIDESDRASHSAAPVKTLLLWGGADEDGVPFLEPSFVVDAPPVLPDSSGAYGITGRTADGVELFSLSFAMSEVADGDGRSSFVFALPAPSRWAGDLASVTLSGPGGSVSLDGDSHLPMTILRDFRTGRIQGFLRQEPLAARAAMDAAGRTGPGIVTLFSRGIPGAEAWRR